MRAPAASGMHCARALASPLCTHFPDTPAELCCSSSSKLSSAMCRHKGIGMNRARKRKSAPPVPDPEGVDQPSDVERGPTRPPEAPPADAPAKPEVRAEAYWRGR